MTIHHPNCKKSRCRVCFQDHEALEKLLREKIGNLSVDFLGDYRKFFEKRNGISAETEWGWAIPAVFDDNQIEAYVADWKEPR